MDTESLLIECPKCNHPYSKRAEKCPKCGATQEATCGICQNMIPKSAEVCPECGDPAPFGEIKDVSLETPGRPDPEQDKSPSSEYLDSFAATTGPEAVEKKMNPLLRWVIIIGSVFGTLTIIQTIKVLLMDAGVQGPRDPGFAALITVLADGLPVLVGFYSFYKTKPRKHKQETRTNDTEEVNSHSSTSINEAISDNIPETTNLEDSIDSSRNPEPNSSEDELDPNVSIDNISSDPEEVGGKNGNDSGELSKWESVGITVSVILIILTMFIAVALIF